MDYGDGNVDIGDYLVKSNGNIDCGGCNTNYGDNLVNSNVDVSMIVGVSNALHFEHG